MNKVTGNLRRDVVSGCFKNGRQPVNRMRKISIAEYGQQMDKVHKTVELDMCFLFIIIALRKAGNFLQQNEAYLNVLVNHSHIFPESVEVNMRRT